MPDNQILKFDIGGGGTLEAEAGVVRVVLGTTLIVNFLGEPQIFALMQACLFACGARCEALLDAVNEQMEAESKT